MDIFQGGTGLYFYSAVFQGNMALLAVLGAFAIFKLQQLVARVAEYEESIKLFVDRRTEMYRMEKDFPTRFVPVSEYDATLNLVIAGKGYNAEAVSCAKSIKDDEKYKTLSEAYSFKRSNLMHLRESLKTPLFGTLLVISVSLIALPFANWLHANRNLELFCFAGVILLNIAVLVVNINVVLKVLQYNSVEHQQ